MKMANLRDVAPPSASVRALRTDEKVWQLNLDQIEAQTGRILSKVYSNASSVGSSTQPFDNGNVLFSKLRPYLNKVVLPDESGIATTELVPLRPDPERLERSYLAYYLRSPSFVSWASNEVAGAKMPRLVMQSFWKQQIPLPPLAEQKRIAAILDKADAIRRKLQQSLRLTDDFLRSVFLDMFGDPVTNPMAWDDSSVLGEIADLVSGVTKGRKLDGKQTREVPYLAVANVQDKRLNLATVKVVPATSEEIQKYRLIKNDLLLTEGGDPDKLGRGTLWQDELPECIHQNHIFRVRLTNPAFHPVFLNWLIGSERGKKYFLRSAKQTTGIASINMTQLRAFPMLAPPFQLQTKFAAIVSKTQNKIQKSTNLLTEAETLLSSLQQRAFRGEL